LPGWKPSYTITPELIARRQDVMPPQYAYVNGDMLESITLMRTVRFLLRRKNCLMERNDVLLKVNAKKLRAGE
jgi:hypothetical protein